MRLAAARSLYDWLDRGGPSPASKGAGPDAPPLVHLSDGVKIEGDEHNITMRASQPLESGHIVCAVAMSSVLHPLSETVPRHRRCGCSLLHVRCMRALSGQ